MNDSSVLTNYSITSSDTITIGNITSSTTGTYYTSAGLGNNSGTITISNGGTSSSTSGPYTISGAGSGFSWHVPEEWDGCFPDWARIQDMCEQYPALQIAFEKFKTTYKLVKDHYDTPEDQRPLP
jgi:hypothetical protein